MYVPGTTVTEINEAANKLMEAQMLELGLFTKEDIEKQDNGNPLFKKYFMHGVAHHIGLDVHDVGSKHEKFKPGMVLTCEPGIYIPEEGFGIRIENDILITETEPIDLMESIPIEVDEIEAVMSGLTKSE
jgi:Xaa-Pro aminopeptidase